MSKTTLPQDGQNPSTPPHRPSIFREGIEVSASFFDEYYNKARKPGIMVFLVLATYYPDADVDIESLAPQVNLSTSTLRRTFERFQSPDASCGLFEIKRRMFSWAEAKDLLCQKHPQDISLLGGEICAWCGCITATLHAHHYPMPKSRGGQDVVNICPNCHTEFHALTTPKLFVRLTDKARALFRRVQA